MGMTACEASASTGRGVDATGAVCCNRKHCNLYPTLTKETVLLHTQMSSDKSRSDCWILLCCIQCCRCEYWSRFAYAPEFPGHHHILKDRYMFFYRFLVGFCFSSLL